MTRNTAASLLALLLLSAAAGCGDSALDDSTTTTESVTTTTEPVTTTATTAPPATTTTTTPATTTTAGTTTTTYAWDTHAVEAEMKCVIRHRPGDDLNVRAGPSTDFGVIGGLAHDAAGFTSTGVAAYDGDGREWLEVDYDGGIGWVAGWLVTPNACTISDPVTHCVVDTACTDRLNVRSGPGGSFEKIGSLAHDAVDIPGTSWVSTDGDGRIWVQIEWAGGVAWVAGWYLTQEPCSASSGQPCSCPADGWYIVLIHAVDVPGRMMDYDPVTWVWTGPADTEGYFENPDTSLLHLPIADTTEVLACPPSDLLTCEPPEHISYSLADLAQWIADDTEIGQNRRFLTEIPGHNGQLWLIYLDGCSVAMIEGRWVP